MRSAFLRLSAFDASKVNSVLKELADEATSFVRSGAPDAVPTLECAAYMRYSGQGWEVPVTVEVRDYAGSEVDVFRKGFEDVYEQLFGRLIDKLDIEIVSWSLRASSEAYPAPRVERVEAARRLEPTVTRKMFEAKAAGFVTSNVVARAELKVGDCVPGPAVITENETTTIITDGQEAIFQADGCLLVRSKA